MVLLLYSDLDASLSQVLKQLQHVVDVALMKRITKYHQLFHVGKISIIVYSIKVLTKGFSSKQQN